jgi:hypothetical protein
VAVQSEEIICLLPRKQNVYPDSDRGYENRGLRVLLGIGEGLRRLLNFEKPPNTFDKGLFFNIENSSINQVSI